MRILSARIFSKSFGGKIGTAVTMGNPGQKINKSFLKCDSLVKTFDRIKGLSELNA